ncbi:MAG: alpha/beta fold hydrolase [Methylosarcina sp.]
MLENEFYTQERHGPFEYFELGDFLLESGEVLADAKIAYALHGKLNEAKNNAILMTIMFSGTSKNMEHYIGKDLALDPTKYCIILPNQLGNGLSTSSQNAHESQARSKFPRLSIGDDVEAQHRLLTERFGIKELQLVTGWSMGAQQTYEWAIRYPEMIKRAVPIAGTAKCTPHDRLFVDVFCEALKSDPAWENGEYTEPHACQTGLKRLAQVFALMGCSAEFYKQRYWKRLGFESLQQCLTDFWEAWFLPMDPNVLLKMAEKWKNGDSSARYDGDLVRALKRITAKTHVVAFEQDMFIPVEDCRYEQKCIHGSELKVISSSMGHFSMLGCFEEDFLSIDNVYKEILSHNC